MIKNLFNCFFLASFLILLPCVAHSQQRVIDSLQNLLPHSTEDTNKVKILNRLSFSLWNSKPDKMLGYALEAGQLSDKLNYSKGKNQSLRNQGVYYWAIGDYDSAIIVHKKALALAQKRKDNVEIAHGYNNLAICYEKKGAYYQSIEAHYQSLKIREQRKDTLGMSISFMNIGAMHYLLEDYDKSLTYYLQSLTFKKVVKDSLGLGMVFNNLGIIYDEFDKVDSALYYLNEALEIYNALGYGDYTQDIYEDIGAIYLESDDLKQGLKYLNIAIDMADRAEDPLVQVAARNLLSTAYMQKKDFAKALSYLNQALVLSDSSATFLLKETYRNLSEVYENLSQYKKAFKYHVLFKSVSDSLLNKEEIQKVERLENKYEFEKEKELLTAKQIQKDLEYKQELERQKWIQYFAFTGFAFILIIAVIIYRSYQIKKQDNRQLAHQADILALKNEELQVLREKEQEMMQKEREYMEENVANKERQLATTTMLSHEKNALLNQLLGQVKKVKENANEPSTFEELKEAEKLIQKNLNMKNSWESFVFQFENVHPDFFKKIKEMHEGITQTELKMAAYLKIGFNNKEIAQVSNITAGAVKKSINRLKKRLDLGAEDDVRDYVANI